MNEIRPMNTDDNMIKITFNRIFSDYMDQQEYQDSEYLSPIIITNDDTFNIPTVYKPLLEPSGDTHTEFTDSVGRVQDIIDSIVIKYYVNNGQVCQKMDLPESMMIGYGFNGIFKKFKDYAIEDVTSNKDLSYINYDGLIMLLITYVQSLKQEINELKNIPTPEP